VAEGIKRRKGMKIENPYFVTVLNNAGIVRDIEVYDHEFEAVNRKIELDRFYQNVFVSDTKSINNNIKWIKAI